MSATTTTMTDWETVIGLEVHAELATRTKLFCGCPNRFGDEPNTNVCPVCLGLPGSLPVLNEQAVALAMRLGRALRCEVRRSIFARKNYFYPDMPKDYQISQYDLPINVEGWLELPSGHRVGIERAHIEEDTGKSTHVGGGGRIHDAGYSLVDYNRSGVPLLEIVSKPDLRSADDARAYVSELRAILLATGASDAKMEEGSLRVDANVSVHRPGEPFGTRCEIKNLNSLRSLGRAIEYEARRQIELIEAGESVRQETRHWNEAEGRTGTLRTKEEAEDYRYFPEPDLVPVEPPADLVATVGGEVPEAPGLRMRRLAPELGFELAETLVTSGRDRLYERTPGERRAVANVVMNQLAAAGVDPDTVNADELGKLVEARDRIPRAAFLDALAHAGDPDFAADRYLAEATVADVSELEPIVDEVVAAHPAEAEAFRGGKQGLLGFFVGQVMRRTDGKADAKVVNELLRKRLGA